MSVSDRIVCWLDAGESGWDGVRLDQVMDKSPPNFNSIEQTYKSYQRQTLSVLTLQGSLCCKAAVAVCMLYDTCVKLGSAAVVMWSSCHSHGSHETLETRNKTCLTLPDCFADNIAMVTASEQVSHNSMTAFAQAHTVTIICCFYNLRNIH